MKKIIFIMLLIFLLALGVWMIANNKTAHWAGVDKTVVEHYARQAGHPPREPYINTDKGDLLLFLFLLAGTVGGFIGGYCFRSIFPPQDAKREGRRDV